MNEQSFNPQENTPNSPNPAQGSPNAQGIPPHGDPAYQQSGYNPQSNPGGYSGHTAGGQSQQTFNAGPQQPPPDPQKMAEDQFANELKQAYADYERMVASADAMLQRGDIKPDVADKIKQSAKDKLEKTIAAATEHFSAKTAGKAQAHTHPSFSSAKPYTSKMYRSENDKMIAGVCGGLAEYFGIDSTIVRIIFFAVPCLGMLPGIFMAVIAYIMLSVILPVKTASGEFRRMF